MAKNRRFPSKRAREFAHKRLRDFLKKNQKQIQQDNIIAQDIAARFGVTSATVHKFARELGIEIGRYEKLSLAEDPRFKFGKERLQSWGAFGIVLPAGVKKKDFTNNGKTNK